MKKRILVIEDDLSLREFMIKYFLEKENYEVITAENGEVGLEKAKQDLPDLIICDIMMPKKDGYQVLKELHSHPPTATIPFIFLTAMSDRANIRDGMNLGADDFLTKPFVSQELIAAVHRRLDKKESTEKRANEKLKTLREKITSVLPHEFRTPLSTILSASNILLDECDTIDKEELREMLGYINASAKRLNRLIENYLLYISLENTVLSDEARSEKTLFSDEYVKETVVNQMKKYHREGDLVWKSSLPPSAPHAAIAESFLTKIIEEITDNCCKFSDAGSAITVAVGVEDNKIIFSFSDCGIGMTKEQIAEIGAFMQFNREVREQQGGGFGLTLAKRILELHSAKLSIESDPGVLTVIRCSVPIAA
jgi:DNA-binding response OmpR family regulator/anti-sigma regulatory factor (Ser/Thr protein kinase)